VLDSINAEELGRFPDADVADSWNICPASHRPNDGGEGIQVNVRGLDLRQHHHAEQSHPRHG